MRRDWLERLSGIAVGLAVVMVLAPVASAHAMANAVGVVRVEVVGFGGAPALPGATVQLVNIETAEVVATAQTDEQGVAAFDALPYGLYQLRASATGFIDSASPLLPVVDSAPESTVRLEMQGEQCSCDPNSPDYSEDCECKEGSSTGVIVAAAAGFTFLGLGGGAAIAALIGVVGAAVGAGFGIASAVNNEATP